MMKKIIISGLIFLLLISFVSALTVTSEQLSTKTDQEIKSYLINNLAFKSRGVDMSDEYWYWYYSTKALEPIAEEDGNYTLKEVSLKLVIRFADWDECSQEYTQSQCTLKLVYNDENSLQSQLNRQGKTLFEQMKKYRDTAKRTNTLNNLNLNLNNI